MDPPPSRLDPVLRQLVGGAIPLVVGPHGHAASVPMSMFIRRMSPSAGSNPDRHPPPAGADSPSDRPGRRLLGAAHELGEADPQRGTRAASRQLTAAATSPTAVTTPVIALALG